MFIYISASYITILELPANLLVTQQISNAHNHRKEKGLKSISKFPENTNNAKIFQQEQDPDSGP